MRDDRVLPFARLSMAPAFVTRLPWTSVVRLSAKAQSNQLANTLELFHFCTSGREASFARHAQKRSNRRRRRARHCQHLLPPGHGGLAEHAFRPAKRFRFAGMP